jgi:hypothetical protein
MNDPEQPQQANPWAKAYPYSNEPGSQFSVASLAPLAGSLYSPSGSQQQPQPAPTATVPQYQFGGDQDGQDAGDQSAQFASRIGEGVLAASQSGAKSGGGMGMGKKKQDPYAGINAGQGWNVGGMSGISGT